MSFLRCSRGVNGYAFSKQFSVHVALLPFLEQASLYNNINFSFKINDIYLHGSNDKPWLANETVISTRVGSFVCPSDSSGRGRSWTGETNYRVNLGGETAPSHRGPLNGPIESFGYASTAACTDGLTNTIIFSEKLCGEAGRVRPNLRTDLFPGWPGEGWPGEPFTLDEQVSSCATREGLGVSFDPNTGLMWFVGAMSQTCYNTVYAPNSRISDCVIWSASIIGFVGASSNHAGGVHAAMADGAVRHIADGIDVRVWRGMGTRGGGEAIGGDF